MALFTTKAQSVERTQSMVNNELQVVESDIAAVLTKKVQDLTNLEVRFVSLSRKIAELEEHISELEPLEVTKESNNANGRDREKEEKVPIHSQG